LFLALLGGPGCSHSAGAKPAQPVIQTAQTAPSQVDRNARVTLVRDEQGKPTGAELTSLEDALEGLHVRMTLEDEHRTLVAKDRLVVLCVPRAQKNVPIHVPLDPDTQGPDADELARTQRVLVVSAQRAGGCLQPTLRLETLLQPRSGSADAPP
jgi:hypothetical protein